MENELYKNLVNYSELPEDAIILDVRNGNEHSEMALKRKHYFVELPRFDAETFIKEHRLKGERVYILCKSGMRASKAAAMLEASGYPNVCVINGGISSIQGNLDLVNESSTMSMERQVRIAAGMLVLLGSVLALLVNTFFILLPAFVGCGLIYAGISNTCAMASLLGKLPWNK